MRYLVVFFVCLAVSCSRGDREKESQDYFKKEIDSRMAKLKELKFADSLQVDILEVHTEVDRFLLLSKDIENLDVSINLSRKYFDELSQKFNFKRTDFTDINKTMTLEEIANALKGNELNFYNQVLFKYKGAEGAMFTAQ
ncbi:MAG: hypothetical protein IPI93_02755 [Sphingobacteriaceae bacterium]|nr:hypothetical protein [Sphingobacteriaceae bacterium]MBK7818013.1 hypothetical protein [Sphingobacteriaceae bacterium]